MIEVKEYVDASGRSPFGRWFRDLDSHAAVKITIALERIASGHSSAMKALGEGLSEYKINFGPGYRIYFGKDGERLVLLLGGGTKKHQRKDIIVAKALWKNYRLRKERET